MRLPESGQVQTGEEQRAEGTGRSAGCCRDGAGARSPQSRRVAGPGGGGSFPKSCAGTFHTSKDENKRYAQLQLLEGLLVLDALLRHDLGLGSRAGSLARPDRARDCWLPGEEGRGGEGMVRLRAGCSFWNLPSERNGDGTNVST